MNTSLRAAPGRRDRPPQPETVELDSTDAPVDPDRGEADTHGRVRPVGLLDRLALRIGVALIAWGRRPLPVESREARIHRHEQRLARVERERAIERQYRLGLPPR